MTERHSLGALSQDAFLGGALNIWQPREGYRAGVDPVLLAASVDAVAGNTLLDLGCGAGVAGLCAAKRISGLNVTGVERHPGYAALAQRNAHENDLPFEVVTGDLTALPETIKSTQFDHVIANPPYFDRSQSQPSPQTEKEVALGEQTALSDWVAQAAKRARPKGYVTFIQRAERLPELLACFQEHLGSLELLPLQPRANRDMRLFLLRGRRDGRAAFRMHAARILHHSDLHTNDAPDYTDETEAVLRRGGKLTFESKFQPV